MDRIDSHTAAPAKTACPNCGLLLWGLPASMSFKERALVDGADGHRRALEGGEYLYRADTPLEAFYAIRSGCMKSTIVRANGRVQVTGFHLAGELVGLDGVHSGMHLSSAVALESAGVCAVANADMDRLTQEIPSLRRHFQRALGREIVRAQRMMLLLANAGADRRVAKFLLDLAERFGLLGYSRAHLTLRMTRADIGSYLGLKLESVDHAFARFCSDRIIALEKEGVFLENPEALALLAGEPGPGVRAAGDHGGLIEKHISVAPGTTAAAGASLQAVPFEDPRAAVTGSQTDIGISLGLPQKSGIH